MKKLLTITALASLASLSYGQGYVGVVNGTTTKISAGGAALGQPSSGSNFVFEVLVAPTTVTTINGSSNVLSGGWLDSTIVETNQNAASKGQITPVNTTVDALSGQVPSGVISFSGTAPGTASFAVVGWSANLGPTLADALAAYSGGNDPGLAPGATGGYFGVSAVATGITGAPAGGPYDNIFGSGAGEIGGFNLAVFQVPEPATFALAGMGAAALVVFRRRK